MATREELHRLVDELPDAELDAARSLPDDLRNGVDDDALTPEELA